MGGYCGGVPPLPIPNREVKPACADGTAMQCGRVGGRLLLLLNALEDQPPQGRSYFRLNVTCEGIFCHLRLTGNFNVLPPL